MKKYINTNTMAYLYFF